MVCFLLADGAEARGGEMTAPSSCAKPSHRSGPPARVCAGADTVSIATEAVYAIGRVQIGRGTLGGVATVSAGSAAGCVKGAIVKGVSSQQRRQQQQQRTKHRADLKYGASANAHSGKGQRCAPGWHLLQQSAPLPRRVTRQRLGAVC
ncbi:predicted protein [Postia placenta Mad-698-R]|uniref:Uncharacterized protein n=1 Tax=Postia placenta MAD-698-R-SB12 TaxID=670580 RepID=A0A1X6MIB4_9APHY|nr:hypothetical protein POSPLADRAFT_1161021 [Postia placenta MAD-698-R-SB12]EED84462.1 predicted protein [Postia placenta Mad-698-R]OSX56090.1 hypothetical protein POSPLADRAFT_1161021 [Postia placenta MAD-698-R-SB12]